MTAAPIVRPERFWPRVDWPDGDLRSECWEWLASRRPAGYGQVAIRSEGRQRVIGTHRVAYELTHGPIPPGLCVLHSCDNPPCCNPLHLRLGTHADNAADRVNRGRQPRGSRAGNARLTEAGVLEIRRRVEAGERQRDLAAEYGVSPQTVCDIGARRTWRHVVR